MLAHIGLGSNLGDRRANIEEALRKLDALDHVEVQRVSPLYESSAWYVTEQPDFYNACAAIETTASPRRLLDLLLAIEEEMGRVRTVDKGPRVIDLDLLLFGSFVIDEEGLTVPHPAILDRPFVLVPLADVAQGVNHPVHEELLEVLAERYLDTEEIARVEDE